MSDWAVVKGKEIVAVYTGQTDEQNKDKAKRACASYGKGCSVAAYTPPPADDEDEETEEEDEGDEA